MARDGKKVEINYEEALKINPHKLDKEWLEHAIKFQTWAEMAADADADAKHCEEKVKTIRSEIIKSLAEGGKKPTGQIIEAEYRTNQEYKEAKQDLIEAEHTRDILDNAVSAFRARRSALENLVQLHLSGYFSSPRDPKNTNFGKKAETETKARAGSKAKKKLNK